MLQQTFIFIAVKHFFCSVINLISEKALVKKLLSLLLALLVISCVSCEDENTEFYRNQYYTLQNQKAVLEIKIQRKDDELKEQASHLYKMADLYNSINAYEIFLKSASAREDLKSKAVSQIYQLTRKADLIEGYQDFLKSYSTAPESKDANYRLYEILYKVAEKKNTISAYANFLATFEAAPSDLRETALSNAVSLECQSLTQDYKKAISQRQNDEIFSEFMIDKIGRRIYEEAISDKDKGDDVSFLQNYNTILKCSLFNGTNTKFGLLRDAELSKVLENIESELKQIRKDFAKSNELILSQIANIENSQNIQNNYVQEISMMIKEQSHILKQMQEPLTWDNSESAWDNFCRIGVNALNVLPISDIFFKA